MREDVALSLHADRSHIPRRMGTSQDGASETPNMVPIPEAELQGAREGTEEHNEEGRMNPPSISE